jgi:ribonuclease-3
MLNKIKKNNSNHFLTKNNIEDFYKKYDIITCINDVSIYQEAFIHNSICSKNNYQRLEFFGDSIINMLVTEYLFNKFPNYNEGELTKLKSEIVSTKHLSIISKKLNFNYYVIYTSNMEFKFNGRDNDKIIGDIFESFIAACYIDKGFDLTKEYFFNILNKEIDFNFLNIKKNTNYKGIISIYYQKLCNSTPKYVIKDEIGPSHNKIYIVELIDNNNNIIGLGKNTTKRGAEMIAAENALENLNININNINNII